MTPYFEDTDSGITIYHGRAEDVLPALDCVHTALVCDPPAGISFMGKVWDHHHGGRAGWVRAFAHLFGLARAALLPGAPGLVWAFPRTSHWTACALEDAGFELRDVLTHVQGQGFPKGHDIGKGIDRAAGQEREVVGPGRWNHVKGSNEKQADCLIRPGGKHVETAPATDDARLWDGWNTAMAPAAEYWHLVMNPREKTFAHNCVTYGTGALNIEGCRVPTNETWAGNKQNAHTNYSADVYGKFGSQYAKPSNPAGRWPSNFLMTHAAGCSPGRCVDGCPVRLIDRQGGYSKSSTDPDRFKGRPKFKGTKYAQDEYSLKWESGATAVYQDSGGVSRFFPVFYCPKASKSDRGAANTHPTVKPSALMRWLLTLVTQPERNLILDPFGGSGSTAVACKQLGLSCTLIEQTEAHCETAARRLKRTRYGSAETIPAPPPPAPEQTSLF